MKTEMTFNTHRVQTRAAALQLGLPTKPESRVLEGYAALYGMRTFIGPFYEEIRPGAFQRANLSDVRFMVNHAGLAMGRTTAGTLQLKADDKGLFYRVELPDTEAARALSMAIERGDVSQSSFAFTIAAETWDTQQRLRIIDEIGDVLDVSAVVYPAYMETSVRPAAELVSALQP